MFKGLGNLASLMKQAQQFQGRMGEMQEKLADVRVEGTAGAGMVTVEATGQQKVTAVRIEQSLLDDNDREMLEELVQAAVNNALDRAREAAAEEMKALTGDVQLPGLDDALSKFGLGGNAE